MYENNVSIWVTSFDQSNKHFSTVTTFNTSKVRKRYRKIDLVNLETNIHKIFGNVPIWLKANEHLPCLVIVYLY